MRQRTTRIAVTLALVSTVACAGNDISTAPQIQVARYGGQVMDSVAVIQKFIADVPQIPEPVKAQAMANFLKIGEQGKKLSELLTKYDAAASLVIRQEIAGEVNVVLNQIANLLILVNIPQVEGSTRMELARLLQNTSKILLTIQSLVPQMKPPPPPQALHLVPAQPLTSTGAIYER